MRKLKILLLILLPIFIICNTIGCTTINNDDAEEKGDKFFYDETKGTVYSDLSENFDIKVEKWEHYYDEESEQNRILLSIAIKNKTGERIDNFLGIIVFNEKAADLIASGILRYDKNEPYDLVPEQTANGVSYSFDLLVERDEWLEEIGADKDMLLEQIRYITLELSWTGGKETVNLVCNEIE